MNLDAARLQAMLDLAKAEGYAAAMDDVHRRVCGHVHRDACPDCTCTSYLAVTR